MNISQLKNRPIFHGRRKGRKLSKSNELALKNGQKYLIIKKDFLNIFKTDKNIILEIGFGDGENLINSAKKNSNFFYIGADPFINTTAKCLHKILLFNIDNVLIWPDDIRKIIKFFPRNSISEIKILFPDPWPKKKHQKRRLLQNEFLEEIHLIIKPQGKITIATDHDTLKKWVLEKFQRNQKFEWTAESVKDWQSKPKDCFTTKYELKSIMNQKKPSWFIFKKK